MPRKEKIDADGAGQLFSAQSTSEQGHSGTNGRRATTCGADLSLRKFSQRKGNDDRPNEFSRPKGELKGLQDSLSQYFTPNDLRRSRAAANRLVEQPLEILIDSGAKGRDQRTNSISSSKSGKSTISPKSPHRRDRLEDALSPYFTPNPSKRRMHREGEYLHLSKGDNNSSSRNGSTAGQDDVKEEPMVVDENEIANGCEAEVPRAMATRLRQSKLGTTQSAITDSIIDNNLLKKYMKKRENTAVIKSSQLIRRAYKGKHDSRKQLRMKTSAQPVSSTLKPCNAPSSLKNSIKSYFRPLKTTSITTPVNEISDIDFSAEIDEEDRKLFDEARQIIESDLEKANNSLKNDESRLFPPKISINCYEIDTWYSSPYPQEYACLPMLHICDSCLMYCSIPDSHLRKCKRTFPPGNEIYRDGQFSIFEVDGNLARVYCRNLCLLAKLFIDHKTLYFDVEPFLFYVMTLNDETGCHFVGYFSKEKYSCQKYNLACIVTLPCYQGRGFGRFLIDFSYLLSRKENLVGSPERPLSELGRITYQSYWLSAVYEFFYKRCLTSNSDRISLSEISRATGIAINDIVETLAENRLISNKDSIASLVLDENAIKAHWERAKNSKKRIWLDESKLKWMPKIYTPSKEFRLHSPVLTGANSPQKYESLGKEQAVKDKRKKATARRKINMADSNKVTSQKTISAGKIGRKRPPGKGAKEEESSDSTINSDADEDNDESGSKFIQKTKKASSCKESNGKEIRKRETTTDEDDEPYSPEMSRKYLRNSMSASANQGKTTTSSSRKSRGSAFSQKCVISKASTMESADSDNSDGTDEIAHQKRMKEPVKSRRRQKINDDDDTSESESSIHSTTQMKASIKRKIWKKSENPYKSSFSLPDASSPGENESSSNECEKRKKSIEESEGNKEKAGVKRAKKIGPGHHHQHEEGGSLDEDDDRSYYCSSTSPQPVGDRLPIPKSSIMTPEMINFGGEPDTVNMGGEPGDEEADIGTQSTPYSGVGLSSYRAPVLISHPTDEAEAEAEEKEEEPPVVEQHNKNDGQNAKMDDNSFSGKVHSMGKEVETMKICPPATMFHHPHNTLKIPSTKTDVRKSCSPSSDMATVEMPALDAAEKQLSPRPEKSSRYGDEEEGGGEEPVTMMEDDAPPMLSPQASNMPSNEPATGGGSGNGEEQFKIRGRSEEYHQRTNDAGRGEPEKTVIITTLMDDEKSITKKMGEENITSGKEVNLNETVEKKKRNDSGKTNEPIAGSSMEWVGSTRNSSDGSTTFTDRPINPMPQYPMNTQIISATFNSPQKQSESQQIEQSFSTTFTGAFNQLNFSGVEQPKIAQPSSVHQQQKIAEKPKEKSKRSKEKPPTAKSVSPEKNPKNAPPKPAAPSAFSSSSSISSASMPLLPTTSQAAMAPSPFPPQWFNAQMAQQMAQYYQQQQQQHYYGSASRQQQQQAELNAASMTAAQMGWMGYQYSTSHHWQQAWQMSAAAGAKFPPGASPYPSSYEEWMAMMGSASASAMLNGAVSSSAPSSAYPWAPPGFGVQQSRHHHPAADSSAQSHHQLHLPSSSSASSSFYHPSSHPPM